MRIVVTGASGQLATALGEVAAACPQVELVAIGRPELDLERMETIGPAVAAARPDIIINAAAYTGVDAAEDEPDRAFAINALGAGEVARAAAAAGAPVIQLSTDYVFDGSSSLPYDEEAPTNPLNVYGRSKLEGEQLVRAAARDYVIVRTAWLYSPFGRNFVKTMVELARTRDEIPVVADQRGSPTSALDLADALLKLAAGIDRVVGRTFHIAGKGSGTWVELAEQALKVSRSAGGPSAKVQLISAADFNARAVRPRYSVLSSAAFEQSFAHQIPEWPQSVGAVVRRLLSAAPGGRA